MVFDLEVFTWTVFYLSRGYLRVEFPNSTRSHPSDVVLVSKGTRDLPDGGMGILFPFTVSGVYWEEEVVPVFGERNLSKMSFDEIKAWILYLKNPPT